MGQFEAGDHIIAELEEADDKKRIVLRKEERIGILSEEQDPEAELELAGS